MGQDVIERNEKKKKAKKDWEMRGESVAKKKTRRDSGTISANIFAPRMSIVQRL